VIRQPSSTDVFVVGGGPAGLAAAIAARRRGFNAVVADCALPPIDKACGEGIMPDGLAAARSLGIELDTVESYRFQGIRFRDGELGAESCFPSGHGAGMRRTVLHRMMIERAAESGVHMAWGASVGVMNSAGVELDGRFVRARWIVGADGGNSQVRRWAGLDACVRNSRRYGFRSHYTVEPWSEFMEIHWGRGFQLYITPVSAREICLVVISRDRRLRLEDALPCFPEIQRRLASAASSLERGGVSASRRLRHVVRGNVALVGDASGSVDAITGEGLCLLFQQAVALGDALQADDLGLYEAAHRRMGRRPEWMADLMLLMDNRHRLRRRVMQAFTAEPRLFARMLAMHVGELSTLEFLRNGAALGWQMLTV